MSESGGGVGKKMTELSKQNLITFYVNFCRAAVKVPLHPLLFDFNKT